MGLGIQRRNFTWDSKCSKTLRQFFPDKRSSVWKVSMKQLFCYCLSLNRYLISYNKTSRRCGCYTRKKEKSPWEMKASEGSDIQQLKDNIQRDQWVRSNPKPPPRKAGQLYRCTTLTSLNNSTKRRIKRMIKQTAWNHFSLAEFTVYKGTLMGRRVREVLWYSSTVNSFKGRMYPCIGCLFVYL